MLEWYLDHSLEASFPVIAPNVNIPFFENWPHIIDEFKIIPNSMYL